MPGAITLGRGSSTRGGGGGGGTAATTTGFGFGGRGRFRHAFRHMYFFDLDWARVRPLVDAVPDTLRSFERALDALLEALA
jgi:hypothetical protein